MKKQVTIVGIQHKTGTGSRTQKPYDFWLMHYAYEEDKCEGLCTGNMVIPDQEATALQVNEVVTLYSHFYNGKEYFDAILR